MTTMFQFSLLSSACANLACPNKPGEGQMMIVETPEPIIGGHRRVSLYLCYPCAEALRAATQKQVSQ